MTLFDKVEQHDDMTDDHTNKTDYTQKSHEPERRIHNPQRSQRAHHTVRNRGKNDEWLHGIFELKNKSKEYRGYGNQQYLTELLKSFDPLLFLATDLQGIA